MVLLQHFGFLHFGPVHSQIVYWDTREQNGQSNTTDHWLRGEGEDQQEAPEEQVDDRPDQTHL